MFVKCLFIFLCTNVLQVQMARILVVFPVPSVSHQIELQPFIQELARRGHNLVVITGYPAFPKGQAPDNITEIDIQEITYDIKKRKIAERPPGFSNLYEQVNFYFELFNEMFEGGIQTKEVQDLINDKKQHFDLVIVEGCVSSTLVLSHVYKVPMILFSSIGSHDVLSEYTGAAMHPLLYPTCNQQTPRGLTMWGKIKALYNHYLIESAIKNVDKYGDNILRRNFGPDIPSIIDLKKNVDMVFITQYHLWDNNRPVPPGTLYIAGINKYTPKELPKDIKEFLDSSKHGVIYMSLGTTLNSKSLPEHAAKVFVKVFSKLPYDVLLKWDLDELPGASKNVKISKWLPQFDILHHPKVKLYIMQGGLQSTGEAINAGVPLIGIPMLGDQWYNVEQYVRYKIGARLDIETLTVDSMLAVVNTVIEDDSYRRNMLELRARIQDQPQSALERAVWWTEHVIRHKGAKHLRAPTALISNWDYYQMDLLLILLLCVIIIIGWVVFLMRIGYRFIRKVLIKLKSD